MRSVREYYEIIKTNNLLLMQLINDILDLSKIEADAIRISYEPVDINGLMDTIFASIKLRMPEGVQLFLEKGSCTCCFGADSIRLLQLINNRRIMRLRIPSREVSRWDIPACRINVRNFM